MKYFLMIWFLLIFAQSGAQDFFQRSYGGAGSDFGRGVEVSSSGGYLLVGSTNSFFNPSTDIYLLKVSDVGDYMWGRNIGSPSKIDWGIDLVETASGDIFIAGYSDDSPTGSYDAILTKTNSMGEFENRWTYGGENWDFIYDMHLHSNGNITMVGSTVDNGNSLGWILHVDQNGDVLWEETFTSSGKTVLTGVAVCADETIVVAGYRENLITGLKTSLNGSFTPTGIAAWTALYPENGYVETGKCECNSLEIVVTAGTQLGEDEIGNLYLYGVNKTSGDIEWTSVLSNADDAKARAISLLPDNKIILAGEMENIGNGGREGITYVLTSNGGFLSPDFAESFGGTENEGFYDVKKSNDGGYVAIGETNSYGNNMQIHLVKIDSEGNRSDTNIDYIDLITSTNLNVAKASEVYVYPNPTYGEINVHTNGMIIDFAAIYDSRGKEVFNFKPAYGDLFRLSLAHLEPGIYILKMIDEKGLLITSKITLL